MTTEPIKSTRTWELYLSLIRVIRPEYQRVLERKARKYLKNMQDDLHEISPEDAYRIIKQNQRIADEISIMRQMDALIEQLMEAYLLDITLQQDNVIQALLRQLLLVERRLYQAEMNVRTLYDTSQTLAEGQYLLADIALKLTQENKQLKEKLTAHESHRYPARSD